MPDWVVPVLPVATGCVALCLGWRWRRLADWVGCAGLGLSAGLLVRYALPVFGAAARPGVASALELAYGPNGTPYREIDLGVWLDAGQLALTILLRVDPLAALLATVALVLGAIVLGHRACGDEAPDAAGAGPLVLLVAGLSWLLLAADILVLVAAWQAVAALAWLLGSTTAQGEARPGWVGFAVTQALGSAAVLLASLALVWTLGTLDLSEISSRAAAVWMQGQPTALAVSLLIVLASMARLALVPVHSWLPGISVSNTSTAAVCLTIAGLSGVYLLARFHAILLLGASSLALAAGFGAIAALSASIAALAQRRPQAMVAYGFVAQAGLVFVGLATGHPVAAVLHAASAVAGSVLLLVCTDLLYTARPSRQRSAGSAGGVWAVAVGLVAVAAWGGVPLLASTAASRDAIAWSALQPPIGNVSLWLTAVVATVVSAAAAILWFLTVTRAASVRTVRRACLVPAAALAAAMVLVGAAGFGNADQGSGWAARLVGSSLRLPPELTLTSPEQMAVAAPRPELRPLSTLLLLLAVGVGLAAGMRLGSPRSALRRSLRSPRLLSRVRASAERGWYLEEIVGGLARRPLLFLSLLLRRRPPEPPEAWPSRPRDAVGRLSAPVLLGIGAQVLLVAGVVAGIGRAGSDASLRLLFALVVGLLTMLALWVAHLSAGSTRREAASIGTAGVLLQASLMLGPPVPWLMAALAALMGSVRGGASRPARLLPLLAPLAGGVLVLAAPLAAPRTAMLLAVAGYGLLLGWFPFHPWRLRSYRRLGPGGAVCLAGPWTVAVSGSLLAFLAGSPDRWAEIAGGVALVAGLGALMAAPLALAQNDLRGALGFADIYLGAAALLGLAAWSSESVLGSVLLVVAESCSVGGLLAWIFVLASRGCGPGFAGLAGSVAVPRLWRSIGGILLLGAFGCAGTVGFPGLLLSLTGSFRAAPGSVAAVLAGSLGCVWVCARVIERFGGRAASGPAAPLAVGERMLLLSLAMAVVVGGVFPGPTVGLARDGVAALLAVEVPFEPADPDLGPDDRRVARALRPGSVEQVAQEEQHVGRPLREAPHEPGVPARPIAHVDPHGVSGLVERSLQRPPDAVEHLELPSARLVPIDDLATVLEHGGIMRRDADADPPVAGVVLSQAVEDLDVAPIDVGLVGECHLGRLVVGTFDDPDGRPVRDEPLDVAERSAQVALDHHADLRIPGPHATPDRERGIDGVRGLHVDANEVIVSPRGLEDLLEVGLRHLLPQVEPEQGQLDRDVAVQTPGGDAIENLDVDGGSLGGFLGRSDVLTERIEGRRHAGGVDLVNRDQRFLERLARDELSDDATRDAPTREQSLPPPRAGHRQ